MQHIRKLFDEHPLPFILSTGLILRLLAAIFSKGFSMFDDHFFDVEIHNLLLKLNAITNMMNDQ